MNELAQQMIIPEGQTLKDLVQDYERQLLLMALELAGWNQRKVAASLGLLPPGAAGEPTCKLVRREP